MNRKQFEVVLDKLASQLTEEVRTDLALHKPSVFETRVRTDLKQLLQAEGVYANLDARP